MTVYSFNSDILFYWSCLTYLKVNNKQWIHQYINVVEQGEVEEEEEDKCSN